MTISSNQGIEAGIKNLSVLEIPDIQEKPDVESIKTEKEQEKTDIEPEKQKIGLDGLESVEIASKLFNELKNMPVSMREHKKASYQEIMKECRKKQRECNVFLGKNVNEQTKEEFITTYSIKMLDIDTNLKLGKITPNEAEKLFKKLIKPEFIPRKLNNGKKAYVLADTGRNRESFTIQELMRIADTCQLERSKKQRIIQLIEEIEKSNGIKRDQKELDLKMILSSDEWLKIKGFAFDLQELELKDRSNYWQEKYDRQTTRIREYGLRLSCIKLIEDHNGIKEHKISYENVAKELNVSIETLKDLIR